ncbi:MAG: hypothetical protein ACYDH9_20345 [Limisphaerales bacterium]
MKPENLLDDVFADAVSPAWRDALLEQTLRQVRRKRRLRRASQGMALVAVVAVLIAGSFGVWRTVQPSWLRVVTGRGALEMVTSRPLRPGMLVETRPGAARLVATTPGTVAFVESTRSSFREINDEELLALLNGHPAVLIKRGPNDAELILLNPEDRNGFVVR